MTTDENPVTYDADKDGALCLWLEGKPTGSMFTHSASYASAEAVAALHNLRVGVLACGRTFRVTSADKLASYIAYYKEQRGL